MEWIKAWTGEEKTSGLAHVVQGEGETPEEVGHLSPPLAPMPSQDDRTSRQKDDGLGMDLEGREIESAKVASVEVNSLKSAASSIHPPPSFLEEDAATPSTGLVLVTSPKAHETGAGASEDKEIALASVAQEPAAMVEAVFEGTKPVPDAVAEPPQSHVGASAIVSTPVIVHETVVKVDETRSLTPIMEPERPPVAERAAGEAVALPPPRKVRTLDALIDCGIGEYTFLPGNQGVLGRGKFSSVWLAKRAIGIATETQAQLVAIKHTPLYPHPQVIAQRLLREPNLLATLQSCLPSPHPNLVKIYELIRTPGHFYLVEEYLHESISLEDFVQQQPNRQLDPIRVNKIMDQLVSALRDACHPLPARIAHRDIKPENILINPTTLHITLLDFGLATHFSASAARLTTVCGSPAYHSPELVLSLARPSGEISYWGPEVDAWCVGVTMLRALCGRIYPIGEQNRSISGMLERARLSCLLVRDKMIRERIGKLLIRDGVLRMKNLEEDRAPRWSGLPSETRPVSPETSSETLSTHPKILAKSTSFIPQQPAEGLDIIISAQASDDTTVLRRDSALNNHFERTAGDLVSSIVLLNSSYHSAGKIVSWLKYCLRCAGIIYHVRTTDWTSMLPESESPRTKRPASDVLLQCAWEIQATEQQEPLSIKDDPMARPILQRSKSQPVNRSGHTEEPFKKIRAIKFWIAIQFDAFNAGHCVSSGFESRKSTSPNEPRESFTAEDLTGRLSELGLGAGISSRPGSLGHQIPSQVFVEASDSRPWSTVIEAIRAGTVKRRPGPSRRPTGSIANSGSTTPAMQAGLGAPMTTPHRFGRKARSRNQMAPTSGHSSGTSESGHPGLGLVEIAETSPNAHAAATPMRDPRQKVQRRIRSRSRERQHFGSQQPQREATAVSETTASSNSEQSQVAGNAAHLLPKLMIDTQHTTQAFVFMTPKSAKRHSLHRAATTGTPTIAVDYGTHPHEMYVSSASSPINRSRKGSNAGSLDNWSKDSSYASSDDGSVVFTRKDSVTSLQDLAERYNQHAQLGDIRENRSSARIGQANLH